MEDTFIKLEEIINNKIIEAGQAVSDQLGNTFCIHEFLHCFQTLLAGRIYDATECCDEAEKLMENAISSAKLEDD